MLYRGHWLLGDEVLLGLCLWKTWTLWCPLQCAQSQSILQAPIFRHRLSSRSDDPLLCAQVMGNEIAKKAHRKGASLRQAALALGHVTAEQFDAWVQPENMSGEK